MSGSDRTPGADPEGPEDAAVVVVDHSGTVLGCTADAAALIGTAAEELKGADVGELFTDAPDWQELRERVPETSFVSVQADLQRRSAQPLAVRLDLLPVRAAAEPRFLLRLMPANVADRRDEDEALLRAMFNQSGVGIAIHDTDLRLTRVNPFPADPGAPSAAERSAAEDREASPLGSRLGALLVIEDGAHIEARLRQVVETGEPLIDVVCRARLARSPERERTVSLAALPLRGRDGTVHGVAVTFTDVTEQESSRRRSALVAAAASGLGRSLDVRRNAETLMDLLVPEFADLGAVDLTETTLVGEEPTDFAVGTPLLRVAVADREGGWPSELYPLDSMIRVQDTESELLRTGSARIARDLTELRGRIGDDERRSRLLLPADAASFMVLPLHARGRVLGVVALWRTAGRAPFDEQDVALAEDIGSRAGLAIDNARRYTRERRTAEALQRSLLPQPALDVTGAETAGIYVPGRTVAGTGGSWFDVITLSSTRVAFVVGTVVGHGLDAAAAMGRLQTAVRTLADLDPAPDELLTHLDDLVMQLADRQQPGATNGTVRGATCIYAVHDPVTGRCSMASAGHPPPLLARADGSAADIVELTAGAALGSGGAPFEPVELEPAPGDLFVFAAGSLADGSAQELVAGHLAREAGARAHGPESAQELGQRILAPFLAQPPDDDAALLVARVRPSPEDSVAAWEYPADVERVADARAEAAAQLTRWGLDELVFTTELIVSELVTNAMRYAGGPVLLRLIRDQRLICEVSDPSQTQPHLRRARLTDEGGRGLYLVAQLTHRWGSRYTASGKTIWTEQLIDGPEPE
ncbi:SpoIIE family protein phosphatase [Streptomyces sp. NPDC091265]|uniref:SpoIIE family protein phosphatase n=1 Tax=unclassified Streptomyces TaxID=2593676 RepID=UPI00344B1523